MQGMEAEYFWMRMFLPAYFDSSQSHLNQDQQKKTMESFVQQTRNKKIKYHNLTSLKKKSGETIENNKTIITNALTITNPTLLYFTSTVSW